MEHVSICILSRDSSPSLFQNDLTQFCVRNVPPTRMDFPSVSRPSPVILLSHNFRRSGKCATIFVIRSISGKDS